MPLDLDACVAAAAQNYQHLPKAQNLKTSVLDFIFERLRALYADQGVRPDVYIAVDAVRVNSPLLFDARIKAVNHFVTLPEAQALAAANKRVSNILQKSEGVGKGPVAVTLLQDARNLRCIVQGGRFHKLDPPLSKAVGAVA